MNVKVFITVLVYLLFNVILIVAGGKENQCYRILVLNIFFLDCRLADTTNYNRSIIQQSCPGFGSEWILFPDGEEHPHVVHLKDPADLNNAKIFDIPNMEENVRFFLYTRLIHVLYAYYLNNT